VEEDSAGVAKGEGEEEEEEEEENEEGRDPRLSFGY